MQLIQIPLHRIEDNPWQTRHSLDPDYIEQLASDIRRNGLLHAPSGRIANQSGELVRLSGMEPWRIQRTLETNPDLRVQLAIGHNRKAAYELLAKEDKIYLTLPMQIIQYGDEEMARLAWSENHQRKDLSAVEEARAIQRVIDDFGWTQEQAAEQLGLGRTTITNKLRLLQLPEELLDRIHAGRISERQAMALLPIYNAPEPVRQRMNAPKVGWATKPEDVIKQAVRGASSDTLRQLVDQAMEAATQDMRTARFPLDESVADGCDGVHSAMCTDCPMMVGPKKAPRCGDPDCYDKKADWWRRHRLALAHEVIPLPIVPDDVNSWDVEDFRRENAIHGATIVKEGCPHNRLSLMYRPYWDPEHSVAVDGVPEVHVVCNHGQGGRCGCLQKCRQAARLNNPDIAAEEESKKRLQTEIAEPAVTALAEVLKEMKPEAWRLVVDTYVYGVKVDGREWPSVCHSIAKKLVGFRIKYDAHENLDRTRADLDAMLEKASAQADYPTPPGAGDDLRRRLERIKCWTDKFEQEVPGKQQLKGNLDNLDQLAEDLAQLGSELEDQAELASEIDRLHDFISDVLKTLEEDPPTLATYYLTASRLLHSAPGSPNFETALNTAGTGVVRYCLTLLRHDDNAHAWHLHALEQWLKRQMKEETPA